MKKHNQAFTLIELLVVVLIIGILAAVAVPQYQKAVEKARLTEGLANISLMQKQLDLYVLENGYATNNTSHIQNMDTTVDLPLSEEEGWLKGKYFTYSAALEPTGPCIEVYRYSQSNRHLYTLYTYHVPAQSAWTKDCYTHNTDLGTYICQTLSSQGWNYIDDDY